VFEYSFLVVRNVKASNFPVINNTRQEMKSTGNKIRNEIISSTRFTNGLYKLVKWSCPIFGNSIGPKSLNIDTPLEREWAMEVFSLIVKERRIMLSGFIA
jgi:hypothetical protein